MSGPLRRRLEAEAESGLTMTASTVLDVGNDPYRVDTPAGHRNGGWLAAELDHAFGPYRRTHLRGLHYALLGRLKPDGAIYANTDSDWMWLAGPAKAARFLGYVPFDRILDARNAEPIIHRREPVPVHTSVSVGLYADLPRIGAIEPTPYVIGFEAMQPYHLVIFGEKTSLGDVVMRIARRFDADAYLPSGEISDTLLYQMAAGGAADGRPMIVFTLADCDPAGHQMPISIGRKLQALRDLHFPDLEFEVRPVALTVEQVRELGLPSTPLKETERRAGRWLDAYGVQQTEIDALATLQPNVLAEIVTRAIAPFYDHTLATRVDQAREAWEAAAREQLLERIDGEEIARIRTDAETWLEEMRTGLNTLNDRLQRVVADAEIDLPPVEIPEPVIDPAAGGVPLISSRWSWADQTRALRAHKAYTAFHPEDAL